jgi:hypothetical protein
MSRLGGVALTSPSLNTERISEYKLNHPPFPIFFFYNNYLDTKLDNKNNTLTCKILFFLKYNKNVKFSLPLANQKKCTLVNFFARLNFQFLFALRFLSYLEKKNSLSCLSVYDASVM